MQQSHIPAITATKSKSAQQFIHKYGISQWRVTDHLTAIPFLTSDGTMPTDTSIAKHFGDKRTPQSVASTMKSLINVGLVRIVGETTKGNHYGLTVKGSQACAEITAIVEEWEKSFESKIEPPAPDYSNSFQRLNHTINALEAGNTALSQTVEYQKQIITSLQREIDLYKGHGYGYEATPSAGSASPFIE